MKNYDFHIHDIWLDESKIIDSCAFLVKENRTAALIGPSGCGKTTMLNIIAGLKHFEHIKVPSEPVLGYIFQDARLIPWLTVEQNLTLIDSQLTPNDINDLLNDVRLYDVSKVYPVQLSGGMQRRVSIARAFVNNPDLVLLDEAFSSLDVPTARYLLGLVKTLLHKNKSSALLVTHNMQEALALADDLYFLSNKPSRVIKHLINPLSEQQNLNDVLDFERIQDQEKSILDKYPNILSGTL